MLHGKILLDEQASISWMCGDYGQYNAMGEVDGLPFAFSTETWLGGKATFGVAKEVDAHPFDVIQHYCPAEGYRKDITFKSTVKRPDVEHMQELIACAIQEYRAAQVGGSKP